MKDATIRITDTEILSKNWYTLKKVSYELIKNDGSIQNQQREAYDRGNGAAILLYNKEQGTVVLTRQFRLPTFINGNPGGYLIEACAGLLDKNDPEAEIRREAEEETGYKLKEVKKVFESYMSPGSVTEILHLFVAAYDRSMRIGEGGGLEAEQENIEVLEMPFTEAYGLISSGGIRDAKTIMLLQYAKLHELC